jgi:signal peptidase I
MFLIPSISMENTLHVDDRVVVEKLSSVKRGEVVVFSDPGGWLTGTTTRERGPIGKAFQFVGVLPDTSTEHLIKRVIGLPGDHVVCCDAAGRLTVNGQALDEASYLGTGPDGVQAQPSAIKFDVVVPPGHFFVMGDNRDHSRDSRCHLNDIQGEATKGQNAFVSQDLVIGRAVAVVWPFDRRHRLPIPDTFETVPSGKQPAPDAALITAGPEASC